MSDATATKLPANLYRLSVERYERIMQLGVIEKQDRVELVEGLIYWILNLVDQQTEVYGKPASDHYEAREDFRFGQELPLMIQGVAVGPIPVEDVLP